MKAIELLELYREGIFERLKVEIRLDNWTQKIVEYRNPDELEKEELLQREINDWFIGSDVTDGDIVINIKK